jgi:hypothetical protein
MKWGTTVTTAYLPLENSKFFNENLTLMDWLRQWVPAYITDVMNPFSAVF